MSNLIWAVLALVGGLALVLLEVFIPSGGILGFLAFASLTAAIVMAFMYDPMVGALFVGVVVVMLPLVIGLGFRWLPYTPIGRRVVLSAPTREEVMPDDETWGGLSVLVGQVGKAKTMMLPSGAVLVAGRTVDALSEGVPIDPGQLIRVVEVRGNRVVVRPIDESEILAETEPSPPAVDNPFEEPLA